MTPEELQACRERAEAATPGPWEVSRRDDVMGGFDYFVEAGPLCVAVAAEDARPTRGMGAKRDAAFIAAAREDVPRLLATVAALESDLFRVAEVLGRVQYPDGHATYRGSVEDMVSRAEELTRAENTRGDAIAALSEHRHAALFAAGIRGGPGAWRWASDPAGTILDDAAAWERLLGEMRERTEKATPPSPRKPVAGWDGARAPGFTAVHFEVAVVPFNDGKHVWYVRHIGPMRTDGIGDSLEASQFAAEDALFAIADAINALRGGR